MTQPLPLLSAFEAVQLGDIHPVIQCQFHVERWSPQMAEYHGIEIPDHMQGAVPKRLAEFVAGRALARRLLADYGCDAPVAHSATERMPLWPQGFVGSITHSTGIAASCVLPRTESAGVGIDIEHWVVKKTAKELASSIWRPAEAEICTQQIWNQSEALTLVFSAKESLFKALYPQCRTFFDFFGAAVVDVCGSRSAGQLKLILTLNLSSAYKRGRIFHVTYQTFEGGVMTGLAIEAE